MKTLLSTILLFIPLSVSAELVCLAPAGCRVEINSGYCEMCVEEKVIVEKVVETSATPIKTSSVENYYQRGYPTAPGQNLLTSSIHHFEYDKGDSDMVRIVPFSKKKVSFLVKKSRTRIARCRSGCKSSRWATMGFFREGFYWLDKPSVWASRNK